MWFLDHEKNEVSNVCDIAFDTYLCFEKKARVRDVLKSFVDEGKLPTLVSMMTYEHGKLCGLVEHREIDATFFSVILIIKDIVHGRLQIRDVDLPEQFESGDRIFMDPCVLYSVPFFEREESR